MFAALGCLAASGCGLAGRRLGKGAKAPAAAVDMAGVKTAGAGEPPPVRYHQVRKGDTVSGLARKYGIDATWIIQINGLGDGNLIETGQQLLVSGAPRPGRPYVSEKRLRKALRAGE